VCGAAATDRRQARGKRSIDGSALLLATCARCGTVFQPSVPTAGDLGRWYEYMASPEKLTREPSQLLGRRLDRVLRRLEPYRSTGHLLDVGCGRGELALRAGELGWDVHATEISASCVSLLRPMLGAKIHHGSLLDAPFPDSSFDVVVMVEVLEHLAEPAAYLEATFRLLRPGGAILLTTPNFRGLSGRLRGLDWRVVADEHLTYFDERSLSRLLRATGFSSIRIATTGLDILAIVSRVRRVGRASSSSSDGARTRTGRARTAIVVDVLIEVANAILRVAHLGDGLRAIARRG
jgi:2-polyprenyl-3-methyl-5-hydroxy-6-metoxy-1,4-benzoquinol methylase